MLLPVLLGLPVVQQLPIAGGIGTLLIVATGVHVAVMLIVMAGAALVVYQTVGVRVLQRGWVNMDLMWAVSLTAAGLITMFS